MCVRNSSERYRVLPDFSSGIQTRCVAQVLYWTWTPIPLISTFSLKVQRTINPLSLQKKFGLYYIFDEKVLQTSSIFQRAPSCSVAKMPPKDSSFPRTPKCLVDETSTDSNAKSLQVTESRFTRFGSKTRSPRSRWVLGPNLGLSRKSLRNSVANLLVGKSRIQEELHASTDAESIPETIFKLRLDSSFDGIIHTINNSHLWQRTGCEGRKGECYHDMDTKNNKYANVGLIEAGWRTSKTRITGVQHKGQQERFPQPVFFWGLQLVVGTRLRAWNSILTYMLTWFCRRSLCSLLDPFVDERNSNLSMNTPSGAHWQSAEETERQATY